MADHPADFPFSQNGRIIIKVKRPPDPRYPKTLEELMKKRLFGWKKGEIVLQGVSRRFENS